MNLKPVTSAAAAAVPDNGAIRIIEPLCSVFRRKLKSEGLKYTPERARILDEIMRRDYVGGSGGSGGVFEAEELMASMRGKGIRVSKATVYRTMKLLAEAGIIQQVLFDSEQAHYQLAYGTRPAGLLIDVDTKRITAIDLPELAEIRERVCRSHGLVAEGHRFVIYGRNAERGAGSAERKDE